MARKSNFQIVFRKGQLSASITFEPVVYQIDFYFGSTRLDQDRRYSLLTIFKSLQLDLTEPDVTSYQAGNSDGIVVGINALAETVRKYGHLFLDGNDEVLRIVERYASHEARKLTDRYKFHNLRRAAQTAWERKDLALVAEKYGQFSNSLSKAEIRRLNYARRKINESKRLRDEE